MNFYKRVLGFILFCALLLITVQTEKDVTSSGKLSSARSLGRIHVPWLGLGPSCTGCPQHYCDDDPAIIHGYCCGCARIYDTIPVRCPPVLDCPANTYSLCEDYEYMMYCCC